MEIFEQLTATRRERERDAAVGKMSWRLGEEARMLSYMVLSGSDDSEA